MRQNDELLERYRVVNSQYEEKQQALNSLQEKNLTTRTREQLEEELLENPISSTQPLLSSQAYVRRWQKCE